jgi:prepilin-type N-terminal cleavage/methylation domain-containing protein
LIIVTYSFIFKEKERRTMKKMNNKGFSLVELIIVIAIMAILAGALAPALIKYVAKSRRSSDANNCGTIQTSIQNAYSDENAADAADAPGGASSSQKLDTWFTLPTSGADDTFWGAVDSDLSGGLAAFTSPKTSKLVDGTKVTTSGYAVLVTTKGDVHVGVYTSKDEVYECVPTLDAQMGGKTGTTAQGKIGGGLSN